MNIDINTDYDSTVRECETRKYDSPKNSPANFLWGNIDFIIPYKFFIYAKNDCTVIAKENQYILDNLTRNISKIRSFAKLPLNWNENGAVQFKKGLIDTVIEILQNLEYQPEVFPTGRESILLEYGEPGNRFLGIEVFENRIETFIAPQRETSKYQLYDLDKLRKIVNEFNG
jgi:hypothetical protein